MATGYQCQQANSRRLLSGYVATVPKGTHKLIKVASMYIQVFWLKSLY